MVARCFSENKADFKGHPATHFTYESAEYCSWMEGIFKTDPIEAAKESFNRTHNDSDGYDVNYVDGEQFLTGPFEIKIYELVQQGNKYYWNGNTKTVRFETNISVN